jgi:hypothetical protein
VIAVALGLGMASSAAAGDRAALYGFEADGGRLHVTGERKGAFVLALDSLRATGDKKLRSLIRNWKRDGFRRHPPSAAVVVPGASEDNDVQVLELRRPRLLSGGDVRFRAFAAKPDGALQRFADDSDRRLAPEFDRVRLFIDPTRSAFMGVDARNLPPIASGQSLIVTLTNATFQPPGAQGIVVDSDTAIRVDLRDNFLQIQNVGFHEGFGSASFLVTTADPFLTGSVSLPGGVSGTILTGASFVFPLKAGSFKIGYDPRRP